MIRYSEEEINRLVYNPSFVRKVDKAALPTLDLLGNRILVSNMDWLIDYISEHIRELSGDYLMVTATNEIVMAYKDENFYRCQNGGVLTIPDGAPLVRYGRHKGYRNMTRITGPDFMLAIFKVSAERGFRHYFYGNTQETLDKMRRRLEEEYPGLQIAGMRPSLYRNLTEEEDRAVVEEINATHPDFVWFCLGAPKGCYFAAEHQGVMEGLLISVGAGFNYLAGSLKRAPEWMQKCDLEWLYRVFQEPRRMIRRYGYIIPRFLWYAYVRRQ